MDNLKTLTEYMLWVTITNDLFMIEKPKNLKGKQDFSSQSANRWFIRITAVNVGIKKAATDLQFDKIIYSTDVSFGFFPSEWEQR